MISKSRMNSF